ncbi:MAG: phosphate acyltransferase, partial [Lachnospiraceae bacterium]|nr:phosphate acyltransferase [Lachnospiraceae bacterium]
MEENRKIIIALDAMGGDFAPAETVKGTVEAVKADENLCVKLFGIESKVSAELSKYTYDKERILIVDCPDVIE